MAGCSLVRLPAALDCRGRAPVCSPREVPRLTLRSQLHSHLTLELRTHIRPAVKRPAGSVRPVLPAGLFTRCYNATMDESNLTIEELITRLLKLEAERIRLAAENTQQREEVLGMIARKIESAEGQDAAEVALAGFHFTFSKRYHYRRDDA